MQAGSDDDGEDDEDKEEREKKTLLASYQAKRMQAEKSEADRSPELKLNSTVPELFL